MDVSIGIKQIQIVLTTRCFEVTIIFGSDESDIHHGFRFCYVLTFSPLSIMKSGLSMWQHEAFKDAHTSYIPDTFIFNSLAVFIIRLSLVRIQALCLRAKTK